MRSIDHSFAARAHRRAPWPMVFVAATAIWVVHAPPTEAEDLLTRQQAIELALDVIVPANLDHSVTAFLTPNLLMPGEVIGPYGQPERLRSITSPTWFCWVDDNPQAFFEHGTRYVFINAATSNVQVIAESWWPKLNGSSIFMSDEEWTDPSIVIYSCIHTRNPGGAP